MLGNFTERNFRTLLLSFSLITVSLTALFIAYHSGVMGPTRADLYQLDPQVLIEMERTVQAQIEADKAVQIAQYEMQSSWPWFLNRLLIVVAVFGSMALAIWGALLLSGLPDYLNFRRSTVDSWTVGQGV